jgi:hypothetical protein
VQNGQAPERYRRADARAGSFPAGLLEEVDREAQRLWDELGGEPVGRSEAVGSSPAER